MLYPTREVRPRDLKPGDLVAGSGRFLRMTEGKWLDRREPIPTATLYFEDVRTDPVTQYLYNSVTVIVE